MPEIIRPSSLLKREIINSRTLLINLGGPDPGFLQIN